VADEASKISSPFDVRTIQDLVRLMSRYDLSEIDLREGELRIRLCRGTSKSSPPVVSLPPAAVVPVPAPVPAAPAPPKPAPPPEKPPKPEVLIKSETVGTFYGAATPDAEPYVRVGSRVTPSTVVCIIEAMKIFHEMEAKCSGVITEILVENQQPVEYGQVLFKVDPTA
jgi:acetyl-CoA carboxylase biotin carboxyl carrier protein